MCEHNALTLDGQAAYGDEYDRFAHVTAEGDELARKIGSRNLPTIASHGVLAAGPTSTSRHHPPEPR